LDPPLLLQANESGIQRSLIQNEWMIGNLLQSRRDAVGVLRPHGSKRSEHDKVQRPLQELDALLRSTRHASSPWRKVWISCTRTSSGVELSSRPALPRRHYQKLPWIRHSALSDSGRDSAKADIITRSNEFRVT